MSVNTHTEAANRRQEYLAAMGIDCWRPHTQLPGALSASVYARAERQELARPSGTASAAAVESARSKAPRRTAADILTEAPAQRKTPAVNKPSPVPEPINSAAKAVNDAMLNLLLLECPGHCLIIDDAHDSREQQALLHNLMFAVSGQAHTSYRATPFDWASIPPQSGAAIDVLRGIVDRAVNQHSVNIIILMGFGCRAVFDCESDTEGLIATPAWLAPGTQVIATHSSKELLLEPSRKADTWAHVQQALNSAVS